jgi:hypothetical protein
MRAQIVFERRDREACFAGAIELKPAARKGTGSNLNGENLVQISSRSALRSLSRASRMPARLRFRPFTKSCQSRRIVQ